ncbi:MAG: SDR family oxidoreductase [Candidatus Helarchaeota archaeon]|nr:SDR family oxidoreductase [Candidatus Helarchaeota archaeon]
MNEIIAAEVYNILKNLKNQFENLNILITGGAGFLGSWLCDVLLKLNANVICVDNLTSGLIENINHLLEKDNFSFINHDISTPYYPERKIDIIFHFASRGSPFEFSNHPIQILKANTLGTWIVLGITKKFNATLLFASTSEIYGNPDDLHIPTPEEYYGHVNPIGPRSCYDEAKRAGEAFAMSYLLEHDLDIRIIRMFNTYGPRMRPGNLYGRVIPNFITQALSGKDVTVFGDGTQTRSFAYVTDMIEGILRTSTTNQCKGQVINLGKDREISILELAKKIQQLTNSKSKISFHPLPIDDPLRRCPDIHKARALLGWTPQIDLENGLKTTINWYKSQKNY